MIFHHQKFNQLLTACLHVLSQHDKSSDWIGGKTKWVWKGWNKLVWDLFSSTISAHNFASPFLTPSLSSVLTMSIQFPNNPNNANSWGRQKQEHALIGFKPKFPPY